MPNLTSRDKLIARLTTLRMVMPLLAISMFATVLLSSCDSEQERRHPKFFSEYGAPPPRKESITDKGWFKHLVRGMFAALVFGGGGALLFGKKGDSTANTSQPTQPQPTQPQPTQPKPPAQPRGTTTPIASAPPQTPSGAIWFYRQHGKEFGPFTQDALTQLVACNVIARTTEIRRQGGAWVTYVDVFGV
jgi:hypothetical protein